MPDNASFSHWDEEQLREHIQVQLQRISAESQIRLDLLQAEVDRRFAFSKVFHDHDTKLFQQQLDQRFESSDKAVRAALQSAELAVNKAEAAAEKRFDSVNEFRKTLSDQTNSFVTGDKFDGLALQVAQLTDRFNQTEGFGRGSGEHEEKRLQAFNTRLLALGVSISVVVIVVNIVIALIINRH